MGAPPPASFARPVRRLCGPGGNVRRLKSQRIGKVDEKSAGCGPGLPHALNLFNSLKTLLRRTQVGTSNLSPP